MRRRTARDEMEQVDRRRVGPVQVLQHHEHRCLLRETSEELTEGVEQARSQLRCIGGTRRHLPRPKRREEQREFRPAAAREQLQRRGRHLAQEGNEAIAEDGVRDPRLDLERPPGDLREAALRRVRAERLHQARLPYPALPGDDVDASAPPLGRVKCTGERLQLTCSSDEREAVDRQRGPPVQVRSDHPWNVPPILGACTPGGGRAGGTRLPAFSRSGAGTRRPHPHCRNARLPRCVPPDAGDTPDRAPPRRP